MISKQQLHALVQQAAKRGGWKKDVLLGLMENNVRKAVENNEDFLYVDHGYFKRGWERNHFRLTRKWCHLTEVKNRPDDRMKRFGVQIEPWRKTGTRIVVIPASVFQKNLWAYHWTDTTVDRLKLATQRPVVVKWEKGNLRQFLDDAWAVVTWASVAGVEAALMGVPVFATQRCPAWPVNAGTLEQIETPNYAENRHEWACSLAYANWHTDELPKIQYADYDYSLRDDLP